MQTDLFHSLAKITYVCSKVAKSINEWIARAVCALGEGETVELVSARFREQIASLPDVRE